MVDIKNIISNLLISQNGSYFIVTSDSQKKLKVMDTNLVAEEVEGTDIMVEFVHEFLTHAVLICDYKPLVLTKANFEGQIGMDCIRAYDAELGRVISNFGITKGYKPDSKEPVSQEMLTEMLDNMVDSVKPKEQALAADELMEKGGSVVEEALNYYRDKLDNGTGTVDQLLGVYRKACDLSKANPEVGNPALAVLCSLHDYAHYDGDNLGAFPNLDGLGDTLAVNLLRDILSSPDIDEVFSSVFPSVADFNKDPEAFEAVCIEIDHILSLGGKSAPPALAN